MVVQKDIEELIALHDMAKTQEETAKDRVNDHG
jgi:hypothetical protein